MSFPRYPKYKDSSVAWLGEVPEHWELKPLWTHFRRVKRTGFEAEQLLSVYRDYGVITKASRNDNFNKPSDDLSVYQLVLPGDLAINKMKAWQGSVAISDHRGIVSPAYFVYEALHTANGRYMHYLMRSMRYITGYLSASKGIRVNQWDLEPQLHSRMPLVVPPLPEQTQIAAFLDRETAKIDALVAEQRRLMGLLKEKRQAVISHAVTRGLNPDAPLKPSGIEWLGEVPEHWALFKLKDVATFSGGGTPSRENLAYWNGDIPWVSPKDMKTERIVGAEESITETGLRNSSSKLLPAGRVLMVVRSGILQHTIPVAINEVPVALNQDMKAIEFNDLRVKPDFFMRWVQGLNDLLLLAWAKQGATVESIEQSYLADTVVPMPNLLEQAQIIEYLTVELAKFDTLTTEAQRAIALLQERRSALISAAVTGQIDVRGAV